MFRPFCWILVSAFVAVSCESATIVPSQETIIAPTDKPTASPTLFPTDAPTVQPTNTPTRTPSPTNTPTVQPTNTPTPTPELTPTPSVILQQQLPRKVFEKFYGDFYSGCVEPPFENLTVAEVWSSDRGGFLEFTPPGGTYFWVVEVSPTAGEWHFDSVLETASGRRFQSIQKA